jgi:hypothetical protein
MWPRRSRRQQVGVGEVAVVVRLFLGAHRTRLALVGVIKAGFLRYFATAFQQLDLSCHLEIDRLLDKTKRIDVLDLRARAELFGALRAYRDIGVATERTLLHIAVADAKVAHQRFFILTTATGASALGPETISICGVGWFRSTRLPARPCNDYRVTSDARVTPYAGGSSSGDIACLRLRS